ncbi:MAG: patatin-like phospholipase family protein [Steroidobacteraceae bacterium]
MRALFHMLLVGLLACSAAAPSLAQQAPAAMPERQRIGLVLSGGGARGVAHVGVLRVLEELHVPIDAIAGTSMGAVVGGLYASGMSPAQIERELTTVDWEDAFTDRPTRAGVPFRSRREDREFLVRFPLGFRDGSFHLPTGLIQGQKLTQLLRQLTLPVAGVPDFDRLPTPFRAVATDLETGAAVVMGEGDLTTALRASMSAPGIFAPVERDGRLLVDGGLANNLPIDIARQMGVDRVIVVDVGFPLAQRERLASVANVANQMLTILVRRESEKQRATLSPQDLLVSPDLPNTSSYGFSNLARIIGAGTQAAAQMREQLAALSVSPEQYEHYVAARRRDSGIPHIRSVRTRPEAGTSDEIVQYLFGDLAGAQLDEDELARRINNYYGQGRVELLDYQLLPTGGRPDEADLAINLRRNGWGPNYVRFGLRLQDDFEGSSTFDAALRLILTEVNSLGAEWSWDGQLGGNPRLGTELYLPFSLRRTWFAEPSSLLQIRTVPQYDGEDRVGELRVRTLRYGVALGREMGNSSELRVGAEREIGRSRLRLGEAVEPEPLSFQHNEIFARYSLDTQDGPAFPRRGQAVSLEWRGQVSNREQERVSDAVHIDYRIARSWQKNTAVAWVSAGALLDAQFVDARTYYPLGGFLNLSGMPADALTGPNYAIARLIYYRKVGGGGEGFLNVPMYLGASLEAGDVWQRRTDMSFGSARKDMSLFFGLDTFLGPAWFAVGYDSAGRHALYLSLGRGF